MNVMAKTSVHAPGSEAAFSKTARGVLHLADGGTRDIVWALPEEVPVAIQINSESYAVMMATPADLRDFAVGLVLTEGLVKSVSAIKGVLVMPAEENGIAIGMTADVAILEHDLVSQRFATRAIEGRTGCGLCGVETIAEALKPLPRLSNGIAPSPESILSAARALPGHQPMNRINRSVHAAAWVSPGGEIWLVREDVGRHNALDKLIGALALADGETTHGFVLMTSRCSFELVQKCALAGIGALVTVSAPTALALDLARTAGMHLAALASGGVAVFNP